MLAEYALTPHTLGPSRNPERATWQQCLRTIGQRIFPNDDDPCPIVFSGLHGSVTANQCTWLHDVSQSVLLIEDEPIRLLAETLLKRMKHLLVVRPACTDWPGEDEEGWLQEAKQTHDIHAVRAILASLTAESPEKYDGKRLDSVLSLDVWEGINQTIYPEGEIVDQVRLLRPILLHAQYLELSVPYQPQLRFAYEVLKSAFDRPQDFPIPQIVVYTAAPARIDKLMGWMRNDNDSPVGHLAGNGHVTFRFWKDTHDAYRERVLLAYGLADMGDGTTMPRPRWGVQMTHLPGEGNLSRRSEHPTMWSLLSPNAIVRHREALELAWKTQEVQSAKL